MFVVLLSTFSPVYVTCSVFSVIYVMLVDRALFKIMVIKVGFGVINQGHCCIDVLSVSDIQGYKHDLFTSNYLFYR